MKMPYFHGVSDQIEEEAPRQEAEPATEGAKGDGLHHHELHEDEGGGFHSKHTHPDGHEEHADHATYEEARADMDRMHGHGDEEAHDEPDGDEGSDAVEDFERDDPAGSYGRAAK